MKRLCTLSLATLLTACASTSFETPPQSIDYGDAPQINEADIKAYMAQDLKDSESARYQFGDPVKSYCNSGALSGGKVVWKGWVVPFQLNAKNSYGGYVGFKPYYARYDVNTLMDISPAHHMTWDYVPELGTGCKITS